MKDIPFKEFENKFDLYFEEVAEMNQKLSVSLDDGRKAILVSENEWDEVQKKIYSE